MGGFCRQPGRGISCALCDITDCILLRRLSVPVCEFSWILIGCQSLQFFHHLFLLAELFFCRFARFCCCSKMSSVSVGGRKPLMAVLPFSHTLLPPAPPTTLRPPGLNFPDSLTWQSPRLSQQSNNFYLEATGQRGGRERWGGRERAGSAKSASDSG